MQRFARVLLEVRTRQLHRLDVGLACFGLHHERQRAPLDHRSFVLADLVALRQIGIKVILARKDAVPGDGGADRDAEADRTLDRTSIQHRQRARQSQIDRARLRIRFGAERGRRARENLALGGQLRMRFDADNDFPRHDD